jgi:hypothetical protein
MEGIGLNAAARVFGYAKTTILNWEKKVISHSNKWGLILIKPQKY